MAWSGLPSDAPAGCLSRANLTVGCGGSTARKSQKEPENCRRADISMYFTRLTVMLASSLRTPYCSIVISAILEKI